MKKKLLSLLLAFVMVLGLLPVAALADTPAADVKKGYYDDNGDWIEGTINNILPAGVTKVDKTATKTEDNTYQISLEVVMQETTTTTTPDAAATVLAIDCSGSMAWCSECGEEYCRCTNTTYDKVYGTLDTSGWTEYYVKNEDGTYSRVYYCRGEHVSVTWKWLFIFYPVIETTSCGEGWYTASDKDGHTAGNKRVPLTSADDTTVGSVQFYTKSSTSAPSRMTAAKTAAIDFLKSYSGFQSTDFNGNNLRSGVQDLDLKRWVAVVRFSSNVENDPEWYDVSTASGYASALREIVAAGANGGTNLDAALKTAKTLLGGEKGSGYDYSAVKDITAKNVIALTDGAPTYYLNSDNQVKGEGDSCNYDTFTTTVRSATDLKDSGKVKLYTVYFGAKNTDETMTDYSSGSSSKTKIKLEDYLKNKIATQPAGTEQYAYKAENASGLATVFAAISTSITSGLSAGTVSDTLPAGVTTASSDFTDGAMTWNLNKSDATAVPDGNTTTYTWTKTYIVTIDPENVTVKGKDYYPLNGATTLTVATSDGSKSIPFPIPAGKVTPPDPTPTPTPTPANLSVVKSVTTIDGKAPETNDDGSIKTVAYPGDVIVWTITVTNSGGTAGTFTLTEDLSDVTVEDSSGTAVALGANNSWSGTVNGNSSVTYTVSRAVTAADVSAGSLINGVKLNDSNESVPSTPVPTSNKFTVTYQYTNDAPANASPALPNQASYKAGDTVTVAAAPTSATHNFSGWMKGNAAAGTSFTMPAENVTLTGTWTDKNHPTFNPNDTDSSTTGNQPLLFKHLTLANGSDSLPDDFNTTFTFTASITPVAAHQANGLTDYTGNAITGTASGVTVGGDPVPFDFSGTLSFDQAGTYQFIVRETIGDAEGVTYDKRDYTLVIVVGDADGTLAITEWHIGESTTSVTFANTYTYTAPEPDEFTVDLGALGLIKKSYVSTNGYSDTDTFNFVATINEVESSGPDPRSVIQAADTAVSKTVNGSVRLSTGETRDVSFNSVTLPAGTYIVTVTETAGTRTDVTYDKSSYSFTLYVHGAEDIQSEKAGPDDDAAAAHTGTFTNRYSGYVYVPVTPPTTVNVKGLDMVNHVNYIIGIGDDLVNPLGTITRAEVATIYFRLMTDEWRSLYWSDTNSYTDVTHDKWYNVAVSTLEKAGIIKDTATGGAFRPNDPITRAELSVMAAQFCTVTGTLPRTSFKDVPTDHWAYDEIVMIEYAGWIEGNELRYFRPDDDLTRAECVTIVNRMLNRGAEPENMLDDMVVFEDNLNVDTWYFAAIQEAANTHNWTRTGKKLTGENFNGEKWTAILPATDWAALEESWTRAYQTR